MTDEIAILVKKYALDNALKPSLVAGICMQESGFEPWRVRYEPAWNYFSFCMHYAQLLGITTETEMMLQKTSWGICQTMGSVARELGFDSYLTKLCDPAYSLYYGCKKIYSLVNKYDDLNDAIASYNAGSPIKDSTGRYKNESYVQSVNLYRSQYTYLDQ